MKHRNDEQVLNKLQKLIRIEQQFSATCLSSVEVIERQQNPSPNTSGMYSENQQVEK